MIEWKTCPDCHEIYVVFDEKDRHTCKPVFEVMDMDDWECHKDDRGRWSLGIRAYDHVGAAEDWFYDIAEAEDECHVAVRQTGSSDIKFFTMKARLELVIDTEEQDK